MLTRLPRKTASTITIATPPFGCSLASAATATSPKRNGSSTNSRTAATSEVQTNSRVGLLRGIVLPVP